MNKLNRRGVLKGGLGAAVLGGLGSGMPALAQDARGVTAQTIKLGQMVAVTGPLASYGVPIRAGTVAYLGAANSRGGVNGRKLELVSEDNAFSTPQSLAITRKMVADGGVFALINSMGNVQVNAVIPYLLEQEKIPILGSYGGIVEWFSPARPGLFGLQVLYEDIAGALGRWAAKDGHKKVLAVHIEGASFAKAAKAVEPAFKTIAAQGSVDFIPVKLPTQDYAPVALQIMQKKPDAIIAMQTEGEFIALARELKNQGSTIPIYVWGPVVTQKALELGAAYIEGIKAFSWTASPLSNAPGIAEYRAALQKYAPSEKPDFISLFIYAETKVIVEALSRIKGPFTYEAFSQALYSLKNFETGILPPVTFAPGRHQGVTSLIPLQVKQGVWVDAGPAIDATNLTW